MAVIVTFGTDADGNGIPDEYENPNLTGIVAPAAITGGAEWDGAG